MTVDDQPVGRIAARAGSAREYRPPEGERDDRGLAVGHALRRRGRGRPDRDAALARAPSQSPPRARRLPNTPPELPPSNPTRAPRGAPSGGARAGCWPRGRSRVRDHCASRESSALRDPAQHVPDVGRDARPRRQPHAHLLRPRRHLHGQRRADRRDLRPSPRCCRTPARRPARATSPRPHASCSPRLGPHRRSVLDADRNEEGMDAVGLGGGGGVAAGHRGLHGAPGSRREPQCQTASGDCAEVPGGRPFCQAAWRVRALGARPPETASTALTRSSPRTFLNQCGTAACLSFDNCQRLQLCGGATDMDAALGLASPAPQSNSDQRRRHGRRRPADAAPLHGPEQRAWAR